MKFIRQAALVAAALALTGCGVANRMIQAAGRTLHITGNRVKPPEDFGPDARAAREALAAAHPPAGTDEAAADAVALR